MIIRPRPAFDWIVAWECIDVICPIYKCCGPNDRTDKRRALNDVKIETLQIRMSQAYRMGFQDHHTSPHVSRLFIKKYILSATGQYETGHAKRSVPELVAEIKWKEELANIQANLRSNGIMWNETSQPFITVKGTAQVHMQGVR